MTQQLDHHPLLQRDWRTISSCATWRTACDDARTVEELYGLLHIGFRVQTMSSEEADERLCYYLDIANGHARGDFSSPQFSQTYQRYHSPILPKGQVLGGWSEVLRAVAEKAFTTLCRDVFSGNLSGDGHLPSGPAMEGRSLPLWTWDVLRPVSAEKILWFFRIEDDGISGLRCPNLPYRTILDGQRNYSYAVAEKFLLNLAWFILVHPDAGERMRYVLDKLLPRVPDLLFPSQRFDILFHQDCPWREVAPVLMPRLKEIALGSARRWRGSSCQEVKSIPEAMYAGSRAAHAYMALEAMLGEEKRVREIEQAECEQAEAQRRLEELRGKA